MSGDQPDADLARRGRVLRVVVLTLFVLLTLITVSRTLGDRGDASQPPPAPITQASPSVEPRPLPSAASAPVPVPVPVPVPSADPVALTKSVPTRLRVPTLEIDSDLVALGLQTDGSLEVPTGAFPAGWYTGAPTPGELGPAILAGHVDWKGSPGVFYNLRNLEPGAEILVDRTDGSTATFRVTSREQFDKDAFPSKLVYGNLDHAGLRLITCGGSFDRSARSYEDNIVVFANLVAPASS